MESVVALFGCSIILNTIQDVALFVTITIGTDCWVTGKIKTLEKKEGEGGGINFFQIAETLTENLTLEQIKKKKSF